MNSDLPNINIILGSKSPRRKLLMSELQWPVLIESIDVDESYPENLSPQEIAVYLSELKSRHYHKPLKNSDLLITADTLVALGDDVLMKPNSKDEASEMLKRLSGKKHEVITGVSLRTSENLHSFYDLSEVYFNELSDEDVQYYIENYKPFDKAGAYGAQEWLGYVGIRKIVGSYFNIMGLPIDRVYLEIQKLIKSQNILS